MKLTIDINISSVPRILGTLQREAAELDTRAKMYNDSYLTHASIVHREWVQAITDAFEQATRDQDYTD